MTHTALDKVTQIKGKLSTCHVGVHDEVMDEIGVFLHKTWNFMALTFKLDPNAQGEDVVWRMKRLSDLSIGQEFDYPNTPGVNGAPMPVHLEAVLELCMALAEYSDNHLATPGPNPVERIANMEREAIQAKLAQ